MLPHPPVIDTSRSALFLDVDGTLLDIRERPEKVHASEKLLELLHDTDRRVDGALALVSGRPVADVVRIFSMPPFVIVGAHGAEIRWADGNVTMETVSSPPQALIDKARQFVDDSEGLMLERKAHGFALHYRQAAHLEDRSRRFMTGLTKEAGPGFRLLEGKMVFELASARNNKGTGIARVLEQLPFNGRTPVFAGDDVTDEDGFRVINEKSGISVRVGRVGTTEARYELESVAAVHAWLERSAGTNVDNEQD